MMRARILAVELVQAELGDGVIDDVLDVAERVAGYCLGTHGSFGFFADYLYRLDWSVY